MSPWDPTCGKSISHSNSFYTYMGLCTCVLGEDGRQRERKRERERRGEGVKKVRIGEQDDRVVIGSRQLLTHAQY